MLDATDVWLLFGLIFFAMLGLGVVVGMIGSWLMDRLTR